MPQFHKFHLAVRRPAPLTGKEEVKLHVRPLGWRRFIRFWPYSVGNRVRFRIELENKSQTSPLGTIAIYEDLPLPWDSAREQYPLMTDPSAAMFGYNPLLRDVEGNVMTMVGSGRYTLGHPDSNDSENIANFYIRPDSAAIMWLLGIATPILTGIVGFLIGKFV